MNGISIIIPTRGASKNLLRLVKSIHRQDLIESKEIIIIVNSESSQNFEEVKALLAAYALLDIQLLFVGSPGVNQARNAGIGAAQYKLLLFLDDDCELASNDLLRMHLHYHRAHPSLFALGGLYVLDQAATFFDQVYNFIQMRWLYSSRRADDSLEAHYLIGGHFSAKKEMVRQYEIQFNPKVVYGGSELEFFLAAYKNDLKVELSELKVIHHTNESLMSLGSKLYRQGKGLAVSEKNYPNQSHLNIVAGETAWSESTLLNLFLIYYNYVFWFGYYSFKKQRFQFLKHLFSNLVDTIKYRKFKILERLSEESKVKAARGDWI